LDQRLTGSAARGFEMLAPAALLGVPLAGAVWPASDALGGAVGLEAAGVEANCGETAGACVEGASVDGGWISGNAEDGVGWEGLCARSAQGASSATASSEVRIAGRVGRTHLPLPQHVSGVTVHFPPPRRPTITGPVTAAFLSTANLAFPHSRATASNGRSLHLRHHAQDVFVWAVRLDSSYRCKAAPAGSPGQPRLLRSYTLWMPSSSIGAPESLPLSQHDGDSRPKNEPQFDHDRYSRQVLFAGIGQEGQRRLAESHVAVLGVGATGAATAGLLARAGVGRLTLIDRDFVEPSNLQRQMLFDEEDARASLPKAEAARAHLARINSSVRVDAHIADLVPANAEALLQDADLVLDCTDNFETRYLLNDLCVRDGRPWIYAAAVGAYAATMNILPKAAPGQPFRYSASPTACLACIFPQAPGGPVETCDTAGILATAVNLAASIQVTEALKFLTGQVGLMRRSLLSFDLWTGDRSEIATGKPRPDCEVCGQRQFRALSGEGRPHITLCGRNSVQIHEHHRPVDLAALRQRLEPLGEVRSNGMLLRFSRPPHTITVFPDGRALVQGTTDTGLARSLYARFIGA
jgi:molybdopterin/thiamine biosynthesis adenylyltransferase